VTSRLPAFALLAVLALAGCAGPEPANESMPAPLAEYQYFDGEAGFLRAIGDVETSRSDADLVRMAQASCRAILEEQASRADLRPAITEWAGVDDATADDMLTAASGNLCETAVLTSG
jgi:hypothetical protein